MSKKILVVDDEQSIRESVADILSDEGFAPVCAASAEEGFQKLEEEGVDLVLLDIWMPGMDGIEALRKLKENQPHLPVIMISGHGTIETAVQATKMGAFEFIEKPPSYDKLVLAVKNALHLSRLEEENRILRQQSRGGQQLTGNSPAMQRLRQQIELVAPTDAWVLIRGEHGTGKELVAQTIHRLSRTAGRPMVELNCAAIPEELIESELFGHEKGAFTGATTARRGKFDLADGGVLFLDEIGDMSLKTQAKVLRILQERKFERVGGTRTISVEVRVLAATNKDLEREIERGNFREDLFWRLNVVPIMVPPLRERLDDVPRLAEEFLNDFSRKGLGRKTFTKGALGLMMRHQWPGNIRELRNFIERVMIMNPAEEVAEETVALLLGLAGSSIPHRHAGRDATAAPAAAQMGGDLPSRLLAMNFREAKQTFEHDFLLARLRDNGGNISLTAEQVGLERSHLHKKLKTLGVDAEEERE